MQILVDVPEELAASLRSHESQLAEILRLGLREWEARSQSILTGVVQVLEILASLPTPQEVLALRPSAELQARISELLDKNRRVGLNPSETIEWQQYELIEHLVRMAKARAMAHCNRLGADEKA